MLISPDYLALNRKLHEDDPCYGARAHRYSDFITSRIKANGFKSVLDYGCGKGTLWMTLTREARASFKFTSYDPAIPAYSTRPEPADLVLCLDVLEHIEPDCLDDVLADLRSLTLKEAFFVISVRSALKTLSDGRNAHLIIESPDWWSVKLGKFYTITASTFMAGLEFRVLLKPKEN